MQAARHRPAFVPVSDPQSRQDTGTGRAQNRPQEALRVRGAHITLNHALHAKDQPTYSPAEHACRAKVLSGAASCFAVGVLGLQAQGGLHEVEPVCVLDFYVHEDYQRQGVGKQLFEVCVCADGLLTHYHACRVRRVLARLRF